MKNIFFTFFFLIFSLSCSTHFERDNLSPNEYFNEINESLYNKDVVLNYLDGNISKGLFIRIDESSLLLQKSDSTIRINTNEVRSINYSRASISGILIGAVLGLGIWGLAIDISGARLDIAEGHNSDKGVRELLPITTILGAVIGGRLINAKHTFVLQK